MALLVQTSAGKLVDLEALDPRAVDMAVVGHALAHTCRYNGHTSRFYSVAEHCALLAEYFELRGQPSLARWAHVHDAAEAFVGDLIGPMKRALPGFAPVEDKVAAAIYARLGLEGDMPPEVMAADTRILADEVAMFFPTPRTWTPEGPPLGVYPHGLSPPEARAKYDRVGRRLFFAKWTRP